MQKKIAVVGTGANGSCLAADLVKANYQVALFDQWPEHVEAMRKNGLKVSMPSEELLVNPNAYHLCDLCSLNEVFDYVFVMVKAYDTKWICHLMEPYLAEDGLMVGIQNGMTAEGIAEIVGGKTKGLAKIYIYSALSALIFLLLFAATNIFWFAVTCVFAVGKKTAK